jgi:hypothetical protein
MYTPTPGDVHVNTPLTQISIAYLQSQDQFVAAQVCPVIPVTKQSDRYYVYNRGDFFRDQMQRRAPGTPAASVGYRLDNTPTYFADVWGEAKPIPDQLRGNADAVLNMDRDAVEFLSQQALIRREKIFAANLFTTGKWNTDMTGVSAGPTASQFLQWNDPASNPIEDIRAGKLAIKQATGYPANTLVLSEPVWLKLIDHPDLVDRVKYGQTAGRPATVSREALAAILELDRILVMGSIENTAAEGQTAAHSFIGPRARCSATSRRTPACSRRRLRTRSPGPAISVRATRATGSSGTAGRSSPATSSRSRWPSTPSWWRPNSGTSSPPRLRSPEEALWRTAPCRSSTPRPDSSSPRACPC